MIHNRRALVLVMGILMLGLTGCASNQADDLTAARQALASQDYDAALSQSQAYLVREPTGPRAAEAYYLRGRALEDRPSKTKPDAEANLQAARLAYVAALAARPGDAALEGLIRASLADVAFWQEDYTTAAQQGLAAQPLLEDSTTRAWVAYRAGVSQKRLGQFADGDRTLAEVARAHAGTVPAQYAEARLGMNAYYVQVGVYTVATLADQTTAAVRQFGYAVATKANGPQTTIFAGPFKTYPEARQARDRLSGRFEKALILP